MSLTDLGKAAIRLDFECGEDIQNVFGAVGGVIRGAGNHGHSCKRGREWLAPCRRERATGCERWA